MAIIPRPNDYVAGTTILSAEVDSDFNTIYNDYNGNITNANLAAGAAIVDTKLAQITTAAKVNATALTVTSQAQGDLLYFNGTSWVRLAAGLAGSYFVSGGAGANPSWGGASGFSGASKNLVISRPTASTVDVDADNVITESTSGARSEATSVNLTLDITASGALGLDTGAEASSTWYYVWVIRKSSDGTTSGMFSVSSTVGAITFPSGYDQGALVGAAFNDSGDDLVDFAQNGSEYWYVPRQTVYGPTSPGTNYLQLDISDQIPSALSNVAYLACNSSTSGGRYLAQFGSGTGTGTNEIEWSGTSAFASVIPYKLLVDSDIYIRWSDGSGNGTYYVYGFKINKLG